MPKWLKILLGIVISIAIFGGVAAAVFDAHPLGGGSEAWARQEACREETRYSGESSEHCYDTYRREADRVEYRERWVAAGAGAVAVALVWLLAYLFYIRPRRRRAGAEGGAA